MVSKTNFIAGGVSAKHSLPLLVIYNKRYRQNRTLAINGDCKHPILILGIAVLGDGGQFIP